MSAILNANLQCLDFLGDLHNATSLSVANRKRWHLAFATIYCTRAFLSPFMQNDISNKKATWPLQINGMSKYGRKISPVSSSRIVIDVVQEHPFFGGIDQASLTKVVKEKSLDQLAKLGRVEGISSTLKTGLQSGINGNLEDLSFRREAFGTNTFKTPPTKSFFHFVWEAFKDPTILILLACATLSLGFGIKEHSPKDGWYHGGSIFVAVFQVISVSAISNFSQNRQFEKLSKVSNNIQVEVVRNGRRQQISIFEIVVGDVICLKIGDQVSADGLFLEGHSVLVNSYQHPFLLSGTKVADGYAKMLVTSVGMNTTWGEMMSTINRDSDKETPLQARLNKLTSSKGMVGMAVASLLLVVLLIRYFTGHTEDERGLLLLL